MRMSPLALRTAKEVVRDPLSLVFGIGLPLVLLLLMTLIMRNVPGSPATFAVEAFAPGMAVFGLSFLALFVGMLLAGDRESSYLARLFASPLRASDYVLGYALPMIPVGLVQGLVVFGIALAIGYPASWRLLPVLAVLVFVGLAFTLWGLLLGCLLTARQVGGAASILVNAAALLSGTWFDLALVGEDFRTLCGLLPFAPALEAVRAGAAGDWSTLLLRLAVVLLWTLASGGLAVVLFRRRMRGA